jgi:hypothetical protein
MCYRLAEDTPAMAHLIQAKLDSSAGNIRRRNLRKLINKTYFSLITFFPFLLT